MNCTNFPMPDFGCNEPSVNENLLSRIMKLPDNVRKEVRLLAKQYKILEVYQDAPTMKRDIIVESPYIIKYINYEPNSEEFTWIIKAS